MVGLDFSLRRRVLYLCSSSSRVRTLDSEFLRPRTLPQKCFENNKAQSFHKEQRGIGLQVWRYIHSWAQRTYPPRQPRTQEVFHFLGVLSEMKSVAGIDLQPLKFYRIPGGKEVLTTLHLVQPEEPTPARPFVRHPCRWGINLADLCTIVFGRTTPSRYRSISMRLPCEHTSPSTASLWNLARRSSA